MRGRTAHAGLDRSPRERVAVGVAVALTVLWHGVLVGWLATLGARRPGDAAATAGTVDIVFVPRRERSPVAPPATPPPRRGAMSTPHRPDPRPTPTPGERHRATPPTGQPSSIELVDIVTGDDRWMPVPAPAGTRPRAFSRPRNPLADDVLDVPPRLQVRVRPVRGVESWLKAIAPAGYEADPCPEFARAIAGLATGTAASSRAMLEDAVDFEKRHCR